MDRHLEQVRDRELDLDALLGELVREAVEELCAERGTLYLVDHARRELVSRVTDRAEIAEIRLREGEGVAGWVARTGEVLRVTSGMDDPRWTDRVDVLTGYHTRNLLAAPIRDAEDGVVGELQVLNRVGGEFGPADERVLDGVARRAGRLIGASSLGHQLRAGQRLPLSFRYNRLIGESPPMLEVYRRVERAAGTGATVLIRGETGTGKELVARAVHHNSERADRPLVKVDCAALPAQLIENELFGHERGAFSGADRRSEGQVHAARGGTLFLDEVGDLPLTVQGKLLRLVQDGVYLRVGGTREQPADVRLVLATHRDLGQMVADGGFREDLYYRIRVVEIVVPPLRDRGHGDLERLVEHFVAEYASRHGRTGIRLSPAARAALHGREWPGNVRELEHAIESAVVLCPDDTITVAELQHGDRRPTRTEAIDGDTFVTGVRPLREVVRDYCRFVVDRCDGNRSRAARCLDIGRSTLLRRL